MVVLVLGSSGSYLTGIFSQREEAEAYLAEIPSARRALLRTLEMPEVDLPCFLLEDHTGIRAANAGVLEDALRQWLATRAADDEPVGNVYWIRAAWRPPKAGTDYMGSLPHAHVGARLLGVFASAGLTAFLDTWLAPAHRA